MCIRDRSPIPGINQIPILRNNWSLPHIASFPAHWAIHTESLPGNDRGWIVGRRTFGKGLVQQQLPLGKGDQIRLTTARYYTPTGRSIQKPYSNNRNVYYEDLIRGKVLRSLVITQVAPSAFKTYMKSIGKLGGQNKIPRLSNDRKIADQLVTK